MLMRPPSMTVRLVGDDSVARHVKQKIETGSVKDVSGCLSPRAAWDPTVGVATPAASGRLVQAGLHVFALVGLDVDIDTVRCGGGVARCGPSGGITVVAFCSVAARGAIAGHYREVR